MQTGEPASKSAVGASKLATLAPLWHTAALVSLIVLVAVTGSLLTRGQAEHAFSAFGSSPSVSRLWLSYLPLICVNFALLGYTTQLARPRGVLRNLLGRGAQSWRQVGLDVAFALVCFSLICLLEAASQRFFGLGHNASLARLLPSTVAERLTWFLVAPCVAFCEEVVYRGYLQTQLTAFTRSRVLGIFLQAFLFGLAHLDRGLGFALRSALYGALFGVLSRARRSLWPGIACHTALDLAGALLR